jgi:hypothetical protein
MYLHILQTCVFLPYIIRSYELSYRRVSLFSVFDGSVQGFELGATVSPHPPQKAVPASFINNLVTSACYSRCLTFLLFENRALAIHNEYRDTSKPSCGDSICVILFVPMPAGPSHIFRQGRLIRTRQVAVIPVWPT